MPEDKSDTRIVAKGPDDGKPLEGLRITKTVRGKDASLYTFLLPGVDPDPLKLSIHPFGEIQLKSRGAGLIARLDKGVLIEGLKSGALDSTLGKFLTPRLAHERAEGFILRPDMFPISETKPDEPLQDVDMPLDAMLAGLTKIEIADTTELAKAIALLRQDGLLPPRTVPAAHDRGSRQTDRIRERPRKAARRRVSGSARKHPDAEDDAGGPRLAKGIRWDSVHHAGRGGPAGNGIGHRSSGSVNCSTGSRGSHPGLTSPE